VPRERRGYLKTKGNRGLHRKYWLQVAGVEFGPECLDTYTKERGAGRGGRGDEKGKKRETPGGRSLHLETGKSRVIGV